MKTKEQVLEHLKKTGYTRKSIIKIMGFLIGKGIKRVDEKVTYMRGEHDFMYFLRWFERDDDLALLNFMFMNFML